MQAERGVGTRLTSSGVSTLGQLLDEIGGGDDDQDDKGDDDNKEEKLAAPVRKTISDGNKISDRLIRAARSIIKAGIAVGGREGIRFPRKMDVDLA